MKLLIAHDGSPHAEAMVQDLSRCGLPESGKAVVFSVADAWTAVEGDAAPALAGAFAGAGAEIIRAALAQAKDIAARGRDAVAKILPGWQVEAESTAGSPAWEIIRKSDEWKPDLLVIGATGTSRLERLVFGTTTNQVVGHVRCSVRVSRPRQEATGPVRLVLGHDGSEQSTEVARRVASRRWPAGSEARVVTAIDGWLLAALESETGLTDADLRGRAEALPEGIAPMLRQAGLKVECMAREADPKRVLIEEAKAWNADCIFVGARGRTGWARLLLGSVALATSSRAQCSVEVVRPGE